MSGLLADFDVCTYPSYTHLLTHFHIIPPSLAHHPCDAPLLITQDPPPSHQPGRDVDQTGERGRRQRVGETRGSLDHGITWVDMVREKLRATLIKPPYVQGRHRLIAILMNALPPSLFTSHLPSPSWSGSCASLLTTRRPARGFCGTSSSRRWGVVTMDKGRGHGRREGRHG